MEGTAPPLVWVRAARPLGARAQQPGCRRADLGDSGAEPLAWKRYGWSVARFSRSQQPGEQVRPPAPVSHPLAAHTLPRSYPFPILGCSTSQPMHPILNPMFSIGTPDPPPSNPPPHFPSTSFLPESRILIILPPMVPLFPLPCPHAHQNTPLEGPLPRFCFAHCQSPLPRSAAPSFWPTRP